MSPVEAINKRHELHGKALDLWIELGKLEKAAGILGRTEAKDIKKAREIAEKLESVLF